MATMYTKEVLEDAVKNSTSVMGVLRYLNKPCAGGTHSHISSKIKKFGIDTSHFTGSTHNKGKVALNRLKPEEVLILLPKGSQRTKVSILRRSMFEVGMDHVCIICGNRGIYNGLPLTLEVDHVDGSWLNNLIENLRFLCPNCHSQQETTNRSHKHLPITDKTKNKIRVRKIVKTVDNTCSCGVKITKQAKNCIECYKETKSKIDWPSNEVLAEMVRTSNYSAVGRKLGVSDNAVRKRVKQRLIL